MVTSTERTGWRDERISQRHRQWGDDCPAMDLDFLMLEYDRGKAVALVEYKHEQAAPLRTGHPSLRALTDLGDRAGLPVFVTRYSDDFSSWHVTPLNGHARKVVPEPVTLEETGWIELLYHLRGRTLPAAWLSLC